MYIYMCDYECIIISLYIYVYIYMIASFPTGGFRRTKASGPLKITSSGRWPCKLVQLLALCRHNRQKAQGFMWSLRCSCTSLPLWHTNRFLAIFNFVDFHGKRNRGNHGFFDDPSREAAETCHVNHFWDWMMQASSGIKMFNTSAAWVNKASQNSQWSF